MRKNLLLLTILLLSVLSVNTTKISGEAYPAIYIDPATITDTTLAVGKNITISVKTDYNGSDVWGWQFTLTYNPNVLHGVKVTNGDLITKAKYKRTDFSPGRFDNKAGESTLIFAYFARSPGGAQKVTSGPGTLANVTFQVVNVGTSNITLGPYTKLLGYSVTGDNYYNIIYGETMPDHLQHGFFLLSSIHVDPAITHDPTLRLGKNYTVSIKTDDIRYDIWGYEFTLTYNPDVLHGARVTNGDLITEAKHPEAMFIPGTFNNTLGKLSLTTAFFFYLTPPANLTSGPGTLANVTFEVVGVGASNITLGPETRLIGITEDGQGSPYNIIDSTMPHRIQHGYFDNAIHDIAVTSVTASPDIAEVGELVSINVNVTNEGGASETFNVTVYADKGAVVIGDEITVGTQTNTTAAGNSTILTFMWNTTGLTSGIYTITANATRVPHEENITNNVGMCEVTLFGPPVANFTYSPLKPLVGEMVTFTSTSYDDGTIISYEWNFGDDNTTTVTVAAITHIYTKAGTYTVNLTVTDNDNETDTFLTDVTVRDSPEAIFGYFPKPPKVNQTVNFVASAKGTIISYAWDLGDGTNGTGMSLTHTYNSIGNYNVTLTVTDIEGLNDTRWQILTVVDDPVANFIYSPETPLLNEKVTFNASLSDPRGGTIISYEWNFGDDNTTTVTEAVITHIYTTFGNHTVTLTITDSEDLSDTLSQTIRILATPTASFTYSPTEPKVEETITFTSTSNDPDGNIVSWEWDLNGDGTTDEITENTDYIYTEAGEYTVTLTVTDNDGLTNTATTVITVKTSAPGIPLIVIAAAVAAIIVIAATAVYLLKIRKPT